MIKHLLEQYKQHLIELGLSDEDIERELERYENEIDIQAELNKD